MTSSAISDSTKTILNVLTISLLLKVLGSDGLRDVRLETKKYIRLGEDSLLRCSYDLESETLYAVKWYRGQEEFYRFIPKELRPKQVFPVLGISVDYIQSDEHLVILKNVSFETKGKIKCVVSVDGSFQTLEDSKEISVVAVGYDSPRLYLEKLQYRVGETAAANCRVDKTSIPITISWLINGQPVDVNNDKIITRVVEDDVDPRLTSTISMLMFRIPRDSLDTLKIKCIGKLHDIYEEASVIEIQPRPSQSRKINTPDSLQHSSAQDLFVTTCSFRTTFLAQILWRILFDFVP